MSAPLIETKKLNMHFGGVHAIRHVDFAIAEGELRCVIGPNGAGKSTFFKILTGQLRPSSGDVLFRHIDITRLQPHDIARLGIGIKTQAPSLFDGLTVHENFWLAASRRNRGGAVEQAVVDTLQQLGLDSLADRQAGQLAHGQRQRVELGVALAADPQLILLDEPTAGMTREETVSTAQLIREINRTKALIVVEHDMQFIREIAGTVTVFNQGAVLMEGPVDQVLRDRRVRDAYLGKQALT